MCQHIAGRGYMENYQDMAYKTIDLRKFSYTRILHNNPLKESGIV